ncbi:response regulator [Paraburkholderia sediminicola]|uniref:response regulator n=1 Tax=Paraburkholderia sediminicola TaxID=458836 RepID=UPI0038BBD02D
MTSVLLVDDDAETRATWEANCIADGFVVKSASDGQSALVMFIETPVEIVVVDWSMSGYQGQIWELVCLLFIAPNFDEAQVILGQHLLD